MTLGDLLSANHGLNPQRRPARLTLVDPRARIMGTLGFAIVVTGLSTLGALSAALAAALVMLSWSGLAPRQTLQRMVMMDSFIIFMLLILPFTTPGAPLVTLPGGLIATQEGLHLAIEIALTANAVILALMTLVGTMDAVTLGHTLARLHVPETLVHLLLLTVRYIEVLRAEYLRMRAAMKARGFRPGTNRHSWRSLGHLVGMMLVRALERSERILQAMKCRGFTGSLPLLDNLAFSRHDRHFAIWFAGLLAGLIALEILLVALA